MDIFEAQTHTEKMDQLWGNITAPGVVDKSKPETSLPSALKTAATESMITSFDNEREIMPAGRSKAIHQQGVLCKINMTLDGPFTGILGPGSHAGLIRLGSASGMTWPTFGILPGFGIKFFRTGVKSADWVMLRPSGPGGNNDFFHTNFSNHATPQEGLVKSGKFQQASGCIDMVGLSDAASWTQDGKAVRGRARFPFELIVEPTATSPHFKDDRKLTDEKLVGELASIAPGSKLFDVHAYPSPAAKAAGNMITIGTIHTASTCHASVFGDANMFFRHQRMEEDFAAAPEWIPQMKALGDPNCKATTGPISKWQCGAKLAANSSLV